MDCQKTTLENGLQTIFVDAKGSPSGCVQIWFRSGSALEDDSNSGIAHFLEHMFFKGTKKRPGSRISHDVESFGGEINAFTSFDYTCYYINTPSSHLIETIDILMDMVSSPLFLQKEIIPERGVVFEEYRRSIDSPGQYSFSRIQKSSFSKAYARPILGNEKTIKNFSKSDLNHFRKKFYNLGSGFLVVAGDLSSKKNKVIKKIEEFTLPKGSYTAPAPFGLSKKSTIDVHQKDVKMSQLSICIESPSLDEEHAAAVDLSFSVFGSGESSILNKKLVLENSLANSSSASTMFFNCGGVHILRLNFPSEHLEKVLKKLGAVLKKSCKSGFTSEEVTKVKNQYVASKVYDKESLESFAFTVGHSVAQTNDLYFEDKFIDKIKTVSADKVNSVFKNIFLKNSHLSLQIPKDCSLRDSKEHLKLFLENLNKIQKDIKNIKIVKNKFEYSKYDDQLKVYTLEKGVKLLYRKNPLSPTFVLHAYMNGGLANEIKDKNGISSLLSGLLTKGYLGVSHDELKESLEGMSASFYGFSGKNAYGVTMHGQTEHSAALFSHFFGSLRNPSIEKKRFDHDCEMSKRSLKVQSEEPLKKCFQIVSEIMFGDHPYSLNPIGSLKSLKGLTPDDLLEFHKNNFVEGDILFTYCGDLDFDEVKKLVVENLKGLPPKSLPTTKLKKKITPQKMNQKFQYFDREQTQIFYGFPIKGIDHSIHIYLKMLTTYLSGQSSKLFTDVRDKKGLCYTAGPVHMNALDGGYWGIYMASGFDKVTPAVLAIKEIIQEIKDKGLNKKEFLRIKKMIEGQNLVNIQTNDDYANIYSVPTFQKLGMDFFHKKNEAIINLKYEDFQKSLKAFFKSKSSLVIVGREDFAASS